MRWSYEGHTRLLIALFYFLEPSGPILDWHLLFSLHRKRNNYYDNRCQMTLKMKVIRLSYNVINSIFDFSPENPVIDTKITSRLLLVPEILWDKISQCMVN